jgi:hypothetical protein
MRVTSVISVLFASAFLFGAGASGEKICDHEVVLDSQGRLLPWTSYDHVLRGSFEFLKNCKTYPGKLGEDPLYLVTSKLTDDGQYMAKQNNQGSNVYYAAETLARYYAYSGDRAAFEPVRKLLDRVLMFHTPSDWAWPRVPRTQDDTPDGEYSDETSEPDKMCMVGHGYIRFFKLTGEKKYLDAAFEIAKTVFKNIGEGDENHSPLPFRVNLKTGAVLDPYTADIAMPLKFIDALIDAGAPDSASLAEKRDTLKNWLLKYPMNNYRWTGYYEDVKVDHENMTQHLPMETARYMLQRKELFPEWKTQVPALINWTRDRFAETRRHGAASVREQDGCDFEMSSHTARYASVVAEWCGETADAADREEARASLALATYSSFNKYSDGEKALNYTGIGYSCPWFSDSYYDYLPHIMDGMAQIPDMAPDNENHMLRSTSTITNIAYEKDKIAYSAYDKKGAELLRITFEPQVFADGKPLDQSKWTFGEFHGATNVLRIQREDASSVEIKAK